jgi:hypothetical protein
MNASSGDFSVHGLSNTLGMASAAYAPRFDYVHHLRQASGEDMGAYDYNDAYDNYEGYSPSTYTIVGGVWAIDSNQSYSQSKPSSGTHYMALTGSSSWANYELSAKVKANASGNVGLMGRVGASHDNYYLVVLSPTSVALYKVSSGSKSVLGNYSASYATNTWYDLKLRMNGSAISVSVDGTQRVSVTDLFLSAGSVGLYADNIASFDDYVVAPIR